MTEPYQPQYQQQQYPPQNGYYGNQQQQQYSMQPTPQYASQQPQAQFNGKGFSDSNQYGEKGEKFAAVKPKWNDVIFSILFIAQFLAFVAISVIALRALPQSKKDGNLFGSSSKSSGITINASTAYLLALISAVGLLLAVIMLAIVRAFTRAILEISLVLSVLTSLAFAVYLWIEKQTVSAIIFTVFAVIAVIAYFPMRKRIPLSKLLLVFVLKIASQYKSIYFIALFGALFQSIYSVYWSFAAAAIYQYYTLNSGSTSTGGGTPSSGALTGIMVFALFSYYWTTQFIMNLFLTTEAGIYGSYYFNGYGTPTAAWSSFRRASTYSMGSIAFGSLIVALLDLLRAGLQVLMNYESGQGDLIGTAIVCCAQCFVGCIASAAQYFNRYAMIEIALYGKPYMKAAKDTWNLFKDRGIDALVNDCLVNNIWTFMSFVSGALCCAFAFIYLKITNPAYIIQNVNLRGVIMGYSFVIGFFVAHTLGYGAISSGVSTIFVGLAEDPQALAQQDPELFEHIRVHYPKVVQAV